MKISTKGRYALRMMLDIARQLTQAGMLRAMRGQLGGYRLAKAPSEYTVLSLLEVMEGSLAPVTCLEQSPNACERCGDCPTLPVWQGLHDVICTYLSGITLETLLRQSENSGVER